MQRTGAAQQLIGRTPHASAHTCAFVLYCVSQTFPGRLFFSLTANRLHIYHNVAAYEVSLSRWQHNTWALPFQRVLITNMFSPLEDTNECSEQSIKGCRDLLFAFKKRLNIKIGIQSRCRKAVTWQLLRLIPAPQSHVSHQWMH